MNSKLIISILLLISILFIGVTNAQTTETVDPDLNVDDEKNQQTQEVETEIVNPTETNNPKNTGTTVSSKTTIPSGNTNTNSTIDGCGTISSQVGMFSFHRPISKSVLVQYSNFTIIWYYNNIIYDSYSYPTNNITLSLFYEEDANSNNWSTSWKKPVWTKTLNMNEIQNGPTLTNNVKSYQWDWKIMFDDERENHGFVQSLRTNEKYKLRISGDGKDLQTNSDNFKCYKDGDIMPGSTRAFYIVENSSMAMKYYKPIAIPDSAFTNFLAKSPKNIVILLLTTLLFFLL